MLELIAIKERGFATLVEATFKDVNEDVVAAADGDFPNAIGVDNAADTDNIDVDAVEFNVIDLDIAGPMLDGVAEPIKEDWGLLWCPVGVGSVEDKSIRLIQNDLSSLLRLNINQINNLKPSVLSLFNPSPFTFFK